MCVLSIRHVRLWDPVDCSPQTPLSMEFPGKNTGVSCHFLFQGDLPNPGLNPCLLHWQADSLTLRHLGSPNKHHPWSITAFFFFWRAGGCATGSVACKILVPWTRIGAGPPAVEKWSPRHWATRELPIIALTVDRRQQNNVSLTGSLSARVFM